MIQNESDGVIVLEPTGDLHEGNECDQMEDALVRLAERGAQVVIDVTHVQHITAHCLGILAHTQRVAWLLRKTRLAEVVSIHDDVASARRYLAALRPATVPDDPAR